MPSFPINKVNFPEPGEFVRFWDNTDKRYIFRKLIERNMPLVYPRRLGSVAPGVTTNIRIFPDLEPSKTKQHIYKAYLGVKPGFMYYLNHPFSWQLLDFDVAVADIATGFARALTYEEAPYDAPAVELWTDRDKYPAITATNITNKTIVAEVVFILAKYSYLKEDEFPADILDALKNSRYPSTYINFGGEI